MSTVTWSSWHLGPMIRRRPTRSGLGDYQSVYESRLRHSFASVAQRSIADRRATCLRPAADYCGLRGASRDVGGLHAGERRPRRADWQLLRARSRSLCIGFRTAGLEICWKNAQQQAAKRYGAFSGTG